MLEYGGNNAEYRSFENKNGDSRTNPLADDVYKKKQDELKQELDDLSEKIKMLDNHKN